MNFAFYWMNQGTPFSPWRYIVLGSQRKFEKMGIAILDFIQWWFYIMFNNHKYTLIMRSWTHMVIFICYIDIVNCNYFDVHFELFSIEFSIVVNVFFFFCFRFFIILQNVFPCDQRTFCYLLWINHIFLLRNFVKMNLNFSW